MKYDSYRFFVVKNESANKIAVSRHIFLTILAQKYPKVPLLVTLSSIFSNIIIIIFLNNTGQFLAVNL